MATSFGGSVKLTGESEYRKALREITSNLKQVSSEMKLTNIQFISGDKTIKETKTSYSNMNNTIQEQKEKINSLRTALADAEKEYGSNNEKVKTFKTQLNNAETQLLQMQSATDKSNSELKEMKNGLDEAGQSTIKFGDLLKANILGDMITSGIKNLANGVKKIGSAILNIGKQSLDSYANYEQLIGGVETLFKNSARTVEEYANNAYKTAGLSANEYMETVTSFSASLLQSLNGDTAKSAKVADMAITDMSDNANKMGTDMTMIQNAYQGFAKQNYTMLDNLKLGYGGTKEEMERLLADAQKLTGVKYDISNLNDVYQAIHVIQGELGITGTTAKEASTTIEGSINSMKSAWQNLLTGIADDNANFSQLVANFVNSLIGEDGTGGVIGNLIPRIQIVMNRIPNLIVSLINTLLPQILQIGVQLIQNLVTGISNNIGSLMEGINQAINLILTTFISMLPQLLQTGIEIIVSLIQGIAQQLPTLIPQIVDCVILIVETLLDNIDMIIDAGIQLIIGLAEGLIEALPRLIEKVPEIIQKLFDAFVRNFPKIVEAGGELIGKLVAGIVGSFWKLLEVAPQIISNIANGIKQGYHELLNVGKYLIEGLWNGISGMASWIGDKIKGFTGNIVGNIKSALGIHSPSTILRDEVGKNMALGIGEGFSSTMKNVSKEMTNSIPKEFDINSTISKTDNNNKLLSIDNLTNAFITAIKNLDAQIVIDKDIAGRFIITSVNDKFGRMYS